MIAEIAAAIEPDPDTVVAHLAGALGLGVLAGHPRPAALHPLVALPDPETGAARLADGAWFAVAGDPLVEQVVADLGGHLFTVADEDRTRYHAAAVIASNHLVALLGQVERVAPEGVPLEAFLALVRGTVDNVAALGPPPPSPAPWPGATGPPSRPTSPHCRRASAPPTRRWSTRPADWWTDRDSDQPGEPPSCSTRP